MKRRFRLGFSLLELFVALTVIAILAVLILPAINSEREVDRKQTCSANLRQIGLAELEYEQTYKRLSCLNMTWGYGSAGGNFFTQAPNYDGAGRWSGFIALLPFLDRDPLYKAFQYGTVGRWDNQLLRWGPYGSVPAEWTAVPTKARIDVLRYPWSSEYQPNRTQIHLFRCPSDPARMRPGSMWNLARTNYAFCLGDGQIGINGDDPIEDQTRGAFQRNRYFTLSDINDGASNTIMFGEIATPESSSFTNQGHWVSETDAKVQGRSIYELDLQPDMRGIDVKALPRFCQRWPLHRNPTQLE
jgi:prepilin-type N-terminal cleavage/methylation domain-containing protein